MNPIVFHIASGDLFFSGVVLVLAAVACAHSSQRVFNRLTVVTFVVGAIAIILSSTAIPYWIYGACCVVTIAWMISRHGNFRRRGTAVAMAATWIVAIALELAWHFSPEIGPVLPRSMTVIGDSVTAGIGNDETAERWPQILQREHNINVEDISHVGETAASALKRVQPLKIRNSLVIVEIGGNDLLGGAPSSAQFERDLNALLEHIATAGRQVVMFELPLPPFYHEYGRIQRAAAKRYNLKLIPRRQFLSVLAAGGATLDTIHLSQAGHRQMAECVWNLIADSFHE